MPRSDAFRGAVLAALACLTLTLTACASSPPPEVGADKVETSPSVTSPGSEVEPEPVTAEVVGDPVVVSLPYGLPDTIGFQTAVVVTLRNPSDNPLSAASFDAEVFGPDGSSLATSDPTTTPLAPRETRTVVLTELHVEVPGNLGGDPGDFERAMKKAPSRVEVSTYASMPSDVPVVPAAQWRASRAKISNCDSGFVGCDVTGRLSWTGADAVEGPITVYAVVHDSKGKIVAAGSGVPDVQTFPSGAPQPIKISVTGANTTPKGAVVELTASQESYGSD